MRLEDEMNNAGLYAAAQVFIRQHLSSSWLNPELIAHQIGCSRAYLYRVFAGRGQTVAGFVRDLRLQCARELLANKEASSARVADIAYRCGFDDPVHFARLFRERYGLTPSALRAEALGKPE